MIVSTSLALSVTRTPFVPPREACVLLSAEMDVGAER